VSTQTVQSAGVAVMPRVNLLPPEIAEAQRLRQLQLVMGGAVVLTVVAVGGLYLHARSGVSDAQTSLDAAQAQQTTLQTKLSALSSVKQTYADVSAKQAMLGQAMGTEVRWSRTLNDLSFRIPSNVWLTGLTATETAAGDSSTAGSATSTALPSATPTEGTITFSGVAFKQDDVATWLNALGREHGFSDPSFSSSTENYIGSREVDNFNTSVSLTDKILSNRYTKAGS
jgi:Tfp pilus assembly protein PilN